MADYDKEFFNLETREEQIAAGGIQPFSNGSEFMCWSGNCDGCARYRGPVDIDETECELELALALAAIGNGLIPLAVAKRLGWSEETDIADTCPERRAGGDDDVPAPPPPDPNQLELFPFAEHHENKCADAYTEKGKCSQVDSTSTAIRVSGLGCNRAKDRDCIFADRHQQTTTP